MYSRKTTIKNRTGLHARPASDFINHAKQFESKLTIKRSEGEMAKTNNAKSMVTILSLGLACGEEVEICGEGIDEVTAVDSLINLIDSGFGEN